MADRNRVHDLWILADAFFDSLQRDNVEYGGWGLDSKRPFGNRGVEGDILEMIGWEPEGNDGEVECFASFQRQYAAKFYDDLGNFLEEQKNNGRNFGARGSRLALKNFPALSRFWRSVDQAHKSGVTEGGKASE